MDTREIKPKVLEQWARWHHGSLNKIWSLLGGVLWLLMMGQSCWADIGGNGVSPWPQGHPALEGPMVHSNPPPLSSGALPPLGYSSPYGTAGEAFPQAMVPPPPSSRAFPSSAPSSSPPPPPSFAQTYGRMRQSQDVDGGGGLDRVSRSSARSYFQSLAPAYGLRRGYGPSGSFTPSWSRLNKWDHSAPTFLDAYSRRRFSQGQRSVAIGFKGSAKGSFSGRNSSRQASISSPRLFASSLPSSLTYSSPGSGVRALLRASKGGASGMRGSQMSMGAQGLGGGRRGRPSFGRTSGGGGRRAAGSLAYF